METSDSKEPLERKEADFVETKSPSDLSVGVFIGFRGKINKRSEKNTPFNCSITAAIKEAFKGLL